MNSQALPQHLAIIMDGNGRWAQLRGRSRTYGHVKGTRVAKKIITECSRRKIKWLTLFAFSTENWLRPETEVRWLMALLKKYLDRETKNLIKENIRLHVIGDLDLLPPEVRAAILRSTAETAACTGLQLIFALSYGSRQELTAAAQRLAQEAAEGKLKPEDIDENLFGSKLMTGFAPDTDLVIRTSGEKRISNFLLWQSAYAELYFSETLWPDFTLVDLENALSEYSRRQRRFGQVKVEHEQLHSKSH